MYLKHSMKQVVHKPEILFWKLILYVFFFQNTHNKKYTTPEEEQTRLEIFKDNKKHVEEHNKKYEKGEVTFTMGLNAFSDLVSEW